MIVNSLGAIGSTSTVGRSAAPASAAGTPPAEFGEVLAKVSSEAVETLRTGEAAAISGVEGKSSVQEVVMAIMSAEQTLHAAVAIRDKVVSAYQEISRMQI
ncbi:flagellar hook-basal body complex protein FliE [Amorphus sp. 3PC139-8]|uniref:flagellar hook-basal body complex protein FliE n=1 Tax=Amorphus sp. 3PC139-8 TaxID=2735676 RepID=UPI00345D7182